MLPTHYHCSPCEYTGFALDALSRYDFSSVAYYRLQIGGPLLTRCCIYFLSMRSKHTFRSPCDGALHRAAVNTREGMSHFTVVIYMFFPLRYIRSPHIAILF